MKTRILPMIFFLVFFSVSSTYSFENRYDQVEDKLQITRFDHIKEDALESLKNKDIPKALDLAQKYIDRTYLECDGYELFANIYNISGAVKESQIYQDAYTVCGEQNFTSNEMTSFITSIENIIDKNIYIIKNYFSIRKDGKMLDISISKYNEEPGYIFLHILPVLESNKSREFYSKVVEEDFLHKPLFLQFLYDLNPGEENLHIIGEIFTFEELFFNRSGEWYKSTYHGAYSKLFMNINVEDDKMYYEYKATQYENEKSQNEYNQKLINYLFNKIQEGEDYENLYLLLNDSTDNLTKVFLESYLTFMQQDENIFHNINTLFELIQNEATSKYISEEDLIIVLKEQLKNISCDNIIAEKSNIRFLSLIPSKCQEIETTDIVDKEKQSAGEGQRYMEGGFLNEKNSVVYMYILLILLGIILLFLLLRKR